MTIIHQSNMTDQEKSLEQRLSRIEQKLDRLTSIIDEAPVMMSMATDAVDELMTRERNKGVDVDKRIRDGLHLLGRFSEPEVNRALNGLVDFVEQAPGLMSMATDALDEQIRKSNQCSVSLDDRIAGMRHLLNKLTDPEMVQKLDGVVKLADQAPGMTAMMVDIFDEFVRNNPAIADPANIEFLRKAGEALSEAHREPTERIKGIFGFYRAINNSDNQRALGFLLNVLKKLGQKI